MTKILISGDRNWYDKERIRTVLDYKRKNGATAIVHGGARGADSIAGEVAKEMGLMVIVVYADWEKFGKSAGPIRNQKMLDETKPDELITFHSNILESKGTKDMIRRAVRAKIPTVLVTLSEIIKIQEGDELWRKITLK